MLQPLHHGQRHGLAAPRRRADDLPLPAAERLERPHLPARADPRRRSPITSGSPRSAARADYSRRPSSIPGQGLVLASAERADLLVDFSDLAAGTELTLWNTASGSLRRHRRRSRERRAGRPRRPAALPGSPAHSRQGGTPLPTPRAAGARDRLPADRAATSSPTPSSARSRSSSRRPRARARRRC